MLFNQGLHGPLEPVATQGVQTGEAGGHAGVRVAPWQSLGSRGLHAARLARLSEWSPLGGPRSRPGVTKHGPGEAGGAEAAGRLHGGGPSGLLLYTSRAGVGPQGWQVNVSRQARWASAGLRAAVLQDVLNGGRSASLLQ